LSITIIGSDLYIFDSSGVGYNKKMTKFVITKISKSRVSLVMNSFRAAKVFIASNLNDI